MDSAALICPEKKRGSPVTHFCTWDNERLCDNGGAGSNAVNEREDDGLFTEVNACFDELGLNGTNWHVLHPMFVQT